MPEFVWQLPPQVSESEVATVSVEISTDSVMDHADAAVNRLALQFRKPNIIALVRALCAPMESLEQAFVDLIVKRSINNATGEVLRQLGALVGQDEVDVTDTTLRSLIRARIPANRSSGTGPQVLTVSRLVLSDYAGQADVLAAGAMTLRLMNFGRASWVLVADGIDLPWDLAQLLAESFLEVIEAGAVSGTLHFVPLQAGSLDEYTRAFRYASATAAVGVGGYGSVYDATTGGTMAAAIQ